MEISHASQVHIQRFIYHQTPLLIIAMKVHNILTVNGKVDKFCLLSQRGRGMQQL